MMNSTCPIPEVAETEIIRGYSYPSESFAFYESNEEDFSNVFDVICGYKSGVVFRDAVSPDIRKVISDNFWKNPGLYSRDVEAPASYVGAYHYAKDLDHYLDQAEKTAGYLSLLFDGTVNIFERVIDGLRKYLKSKNISLRLAQHGDKYASSFVMRSWCGNGVFSLLPHEDEAQCCAPNQMGFEIQKAARNNPIAAVNICIENDIGAGDLHYWNVIPNDETRNSLGLNFTGSPYPEEMLEGIEKQVISIRPGDFYCFNGKAIHAVSSLKNKYGKRATISFLLAKLDDETVIYWS